VVFPFDKILLALKIHIKIFIYQIHLSERPYVQSKQCGVEQVVVAVAQIRRQTS
jgi:hypothetical protein